MGCNSLRKVTIPGSVKRVGALAFASGRNLATVEFMSGVKEIDDKAFAYCPNLRRVAFPDSLGKVGALLFDRCPSLQRIEFGGDAPQMDPSESLFGDTSESLLVQVRRGSKGWSGAGSVAGGRGRRFAGDPVRRRPGAVGRGNMVYSSHAKRRISGFAGWSCESNGARR